jgi:PAS domain S-box-containing protein
MWWGGAIQAIYRGDAIDVGQTLAWKEQRIPTQDRERVRASFAKALASTESRWQETYGFERADGTSAIVQDRAYILRDINGCPRRVVGRLLDITELRESHQRENEAVRAREQSEERLRLAIEAAHLGTWDVDLVTGQAVWNDLFYELLGEPRGGNAGAADKLQLVHPEDRLRVRQGMARALLPESGGVFESEHRIVRPVDGGERWVKARGSVFFDAVGKPIRFIGAVFDISGPKYAEQQTREALRLRDDFLSIASHELKTPLTPLRLQLDNLKRLLAKTQIWDEHIANRLDQAERQTQRLTKLVDSLLDVSRISSRRLSLELEEVELADIVTEVVHRFEDEARHVRSPITLDVEHRARGQWDRLRVEQVVANLLSNAIKYGAGKPIVVRLTVHDDMARIDVQDEGIGIAPDDAERIFARFERAVSMRHYGGLGLGLYIAREIVEAHGGTITVRSELGKGSTFTVVLPLGASL